MLSTIYFSNFSSLSRKFGDAQTFCLGNTEMQLPILIPIGRKIYDPKWILCGIKLRSWDSGHGEWSCGKCHEAMIIIQMP